MLYRSSWSHLAVYVIEGMHYVNDVFVLDLGIHACPVYPLESVVVPILCSVVNFSLKRKLGFRWGNNADVNHGGLTVSESDCNATSQVRDCSANFNVSSIADNEPALGEPV